MNRIPKRPTLLAATLGACALLTLAPPLMAQTTPGTTGTGGTGATTTTTPPAGARLERADRRFMERAAEGGMAEVALGKVARERATDPQVKAFAQRMEEDHGKANQELMQLAGTKGVELPKEPERSAKRDAERMSAMKPGPDFDRAYMKHMVDDHKKTVTEFGKASREARDPEVKAFATKQLPTLENHLELAQTTYNAMRGANVRDGVKAPVPSASR
jgi:putative membrane protein